MIFSSLEKELVNLTFTVGPCGNQVIIFHMSHPGKNPCALLKSCLLEKCLISLQYFLLLLQTQLCVFPTGQTPSSTWPIPKYRAGNPVARWICTNPQELVTLTLSDKLPLSYASLAGLLPSELLMSKWISFDSPFPLSNRGKFSVAFPGNSLKVFTFINWY